MIPIEILALIVAVGVIVKVLFIALKPKSWVSVIKPIYLKSGLTMVIAFLLAAVVLYYLMAGGITIVQIFAVMAFIGLVTLISVAVYSRELLNLADKIVKDKKLMRKAWLPILIWLVLSILVLWKILA